MNAVFTVFAKEVRENLRDKRTVMSALLYGPLIGPGLFVLMLGVMISMQHNDATGPLKVPVAGAHYAPNLIAALKQSGLQPQPLTASPAQMVHDRTAKVVLRIPADYPEAWRSGQPAQVDLIYDASQRNVHTTVARVKTMLQAWSAKQGALRLVARGLAPALATPLVVADRDQSTPQSRAGSFLAFLPYFFVIALFYGGMYLATDLTAGERERQSLEPLFANPVPRWHILGGKLAAVCAFSLASLIICLIGIAVVVRFVPTDTLDLTLHLGAGFAAETLLLMVPLATLLAVAQTLVTAFARSYREAQSYLQIMMFVLIIPSLLMSMLPMKPVDWMYAVPLLGQQIGITALSRGDSVGALQIALCLLGSAVATVLLALVTAYVYRSERLAISV